MNHIEDIIIKLRSGQIAIPEFETWVYQNEELSQIIGIAAYEDLISINFKSPHCSAKIEKILAPFINEGNMEKKRVQVALASIIARDGKAAEQLVKVYDAYCDGYYFLKDLALNISTRLINPGPEFRTNNFSDLTAAEKRDLLDQLYPSAKEKALKINTWLENGEITLTGEREEELGKWQYIDNRISKD